MKIRCDLHVNGGSRKLLLVPGPNETGEHLALKLAAYLLFWDWEPVVEASAKHPALAAQEFIPDLMALDQGGEIRLWVECGQVSLHKLGKLLRRLPQARIVALKADERQARRLRKDLGDCLERSKRVEIWAWPEGSFKSWIACVAEKTEVYGESRGLMLNAVVNERPIVAELKKV
ncbi:MAG: YaeQ family protein [Elusimicrobia bacterium]|nr:YaeQ family protein [Elusimicrobiota bacterium]